MSIEATKDAQSAVENKLAELKNSLYKYNTNIEKVDYDKFKRDYESHYCGHIEQAATNFENTISKIYKTNKSKSSVELATSKWKNPADSLLTKKLVGAA